MRADTGTYIISLSEEQSMDKVDEKAVIGNPVSGMYQGFKGRKTNTRDSAWCSG